MGWDYYFSKRVLFWWNSISVGQIPTRYWASQRRLCRNCYCARFCASEEHLPTWIRSNEPLDELEHCTHHTAIRFFGTFDRIEIATWSKWHLRAFRYRDTMDGSTHWRFLCVNLAENDAKDSASQWVCGSYFRSISYRNAQWRKIDGNDSFLRERNAFDRLRKRNKLFQSQFSSE